MGEVRVEGQSRLSSTPFPASMTVVLADFLAVILWGREEEKEEL